IVPRWYRAWLVGHSAMRLDGSSLPSADTSQMWCMSSARMLRQVGTAHRYPDSVSTITRVFSGNLFRSRGLDAALGVLLAMAAACSDAEESVAVGENRLD